MKAVNCSCRLWITTRLFLLGLGALLMSWNPLAQAAQSVTLAWDRSTDSSVTGYKVYYTDVGTGTTSTINAGNVNTNTVPGLTETRTYSFYVVSYNASGVESVPSNVISYTVPGANTAPTISNIADLSTSQNTATAPIAFTIGDAQTVAGSLIVSRTSSNPTLVPVANIVLGGSGANRTVTVTPALNQTGTATITVTVSDGSLTASDSFVLTVNATPNTAPTITSFVNQTTTQNTATAPIAFTVGDSQTAAGSLTLSATSSNPTLVPAANIVFGGSGANRTLTVTPALNQTGTATIIVTVSDGSLSASKGFVLSVNPAGPFTPVYLAIEAESGALVFPMSIYSDPSASGGSFIATEANDAGTATFAVNIPVAGDYVVWCKILSPDGITDSTYVSMDGSAEDIFDTAVDTWSTAWQWTAVNGRNAAANPRIFSLSAGWHNLVFRGREAFTAIDQLLVTNDRNYVPGTNTAPTISNIADLSTSQNTATAAIAFTVGDAQTAAGSLTVTRTSSNPTLVPTANIVLGGSGANRTVTVTPALNQTGTATITVTVSDGSLTASDSFVLTVNAPVNTAPTISSIANQTTAQNTATAAIPFTVGDSQTAAGSLIVTASSSNPTLVPVSKIVFGGSGPNRTVTVTPALNELGTATITVTVSDGNLTASTSFTLTADIIFRITAPPLASSIRLDPAGSVTVTWPAVAGKNYRVMYKNSLNDTTWSRLHPDVRPNSNQASKSDYVVGNRFYQVIELP